MTTDSKAFADFKAELDQLWSASGIRQQALDGDWSARLIQEILNPFIKLLGEYKARRDSEQMESFMDGTVLVISGMLVNCLAAHGAIVPGDAEMSKTLAALLVMKVRAETERLAGIAAERRSEKR